MDQLHRGVRIEGPIRRQDVVNQLNCILPLYQVSVHTFWELSQNFTAVSLKEKFIRWWQQQSTLTAELETMICQFGGTLHLEELVKKSQEISQTNSFLENVGYILNRGLTHQRNLLATYSKILNNRLPTDVRMLLQRHQAQSKVLFIQLECMENDLLRNGMLFV